MSSGYPVEFFPKWGGTQTRMRAGTSPACFGCRHESWEVFEKSQLNESIKLNEPNFHKIKKGGVGQTTILKFLGGAWKL